MATEEQRQELLSTVQERIAALATIDPKSLARTSDLSPDINFKDAVPAFEEMLDLFKQLGQRDVSRLTHSQLNQVQGACQRLENLITQVKDFDLNTDRPGDACRNLVQAAKNEYENVMNPLLLPLAFTATQATDYAKIEREAKGYHATMKQEADKLGAYLRTVRDEAEQALSAVQAQAAEAGVATNAQIFVTEADRHKEDADAWLKATIAMAAVTLVAALAGLGVAMWYHPADVSAAIQYIVAKVLVLSTLSFGLFWCARNYKARMHNATLNRHRANALTTFRAFVEGTGDDRVKDAILMHAAQAAFAGRQTGFDQGEAEARPVNPVVELLGRTVSKGGED